MVELGNFSLRFGGHLGKLLLTSEGYLSQLLFIRLSYLGKIVMIFALKPLDFLLAFVAHACHLIVVISGHLIYTVLVRLVQILDSMQMLLFFAGLVLFELLDLMAEHLSLSDELILVGTMSISIFVDSDAGLGNMNLEFFSFVLRISKQFFVNHYVALEVIDNLMKENMTEILNTYSDLLAQSHNGSSQMVILDVSLGESLEEFTIRT